MIGPDIPAHLLGRQQHEELDEEENGYQTEPNSIGPQIPSHLLQHHSKTLGDEDEDDEDDDAAGPMPNTSSTKSVSQCPLGKVSAPGPSTGRRPIGPERPHQLSHSYTVYHNDDDDDEIGPRPLPSGARQEEEDAVKRFMEVEETRRKKIEEASKPKALQRDEWMLKPPSSSELLGSLDPSRLKAPRQFSRSAAPAREVDNSLWTETPAEKMQRLADEVVGKRRRPADPVPEDDEKKRRRKDEEFIRRGVEDYTERVRGPSLLAQYADSEKDDKNENPAIWDHARDMAMGGRLMDDQKRSKFIKEARGLGDRFSTGTSGGFL